MSHTPQPHTGWVFAKLGGILIPTALEAKFLSWRWRVGVELLPRSAAVPLAQGSPKSICCAMGGLRGRRDLTSNTLKCP